MHIVREEESKYHAKVLRWKRKKPKFDNSMPNGSTRLECKGSMLDLLHQIINDLRIGMLRVYAVIVL